MELIKNLIAVVIEIVKFMLTPPVAFITVPGIILTAIRGVYHKFKRG